VVLSGSAFVVIAKARSRPPLLGGVSSGPKALPQRMALRLLAPPKRGAIAIQSWLATSSSINVTQSVRINLHKAKSNLL